MTRESPSCKRDEIADSPTHLSRAFLARCQFIILARKNEPTPDYAPCGLARIGSTSSWARKSPARSPGGSVCGGVRMWPLPGPLRPPSPPCGRAERPPPVPRVPGTLGLRGTGRGEPAARDGLTRANGQGPTASGNLQFSSVPSAQENPAGNPSHKSLLHENPNRLVIQVN